MTASSSSRVPFPRSERTSHPGATAAGKGFDLKATSRAGLHRHDDGVGTRDQGRAIMNQQFASAVLWIQIHRHMPQDPIERLGGDRRDGVVLRSMSVTTPRKPDALSPGVRRHQQTANHRPETRNDPLWGAGENCFEI